MLLKNKLLKLKKLKKSYGEVEEVPMSMMRRTVAKRMSESYFTAPVFVAKYRS